MRRTSLLVKSRLPPLDRLTVSRNGRCSADVIEPALDDVAAREHDGLAVPDPVQFVGRKVARIAAEVDDRDRTPVGMRRSLPFTLIVKPTPPRSTRSPETRSPEFRSSVARCCATAEPAIASVSTNDNIPSRLLIVPPRRSACPTHIRAKAWPAWRMRRCPKSLRLRPFLAAVPVPVLSTRHL